MYIKLEKEPLWYSIKSFFLNSESGLRIKKRIKPQYSKPLCLNNLFFEQKKVPKNNLELDYDDYLEVIRMNYTDLEIDIFCILLEICLRLGLLTIENILLIKNIFLISRATDDTNIWENIFQMIPISLDNKHKILLNLIEFKIEIALFFNLLSNNEYKKLIEDIIEKKFSQIKISVENLELSLKFNILILQKLPKSALVLLYNIYNRINNLDNFILSTKENNSSVRFKNLYYNITWETPENTLNLCIDYYSRKKRSLLNLTKLDKILEEDN